MLELNPLAHIVSSVRRLLVFGLTPQWWPLLLSLFASVLVFAFGQQFFRACQRHFADFV